MIVLTELKELSWFYFHIWIFYTELSTKNVDNFLVKKRPNLERFLNHDSEVIRNECQLKMSYLIALKHYYNKEYRQSIEYTSKVIDGYNMEFNWLLGLSYYLRANSFISIDNADKAKNDLKKVLKIDFKFPEKEKSKELLYSLSKVE